jgi:hypothetical protein
VRSAKSLMKHALVRSGSRDVSSQLFTALCRALGVPARLVVSLQSVPWQTNVGRSKTPAKQKASNKGKAVAPREAEDSSGDMELVVSPQNEYSSGDNLQLGGDATGKTSSAKPNGKGKLSYTMTLRKTKSSGQRLSSSNPPSAPSPSRESFADLTMTTMYTQRPRIRLRLHLSFGQRFSRVLITAGSPLILYVPSSTSARFSTRLRLAPHHAQQL